METFLLVNFFKQSVNPQHNCCNAMLFTALKKPSSFQFPCLVCESLCDLHTQMSSMCRQLHLNYFPQQLLLRFLHLKNRAVWHYKTRRKKSKVTKLIPWNVLENPERHKRRSHTSKNNFNNQNKTFATASCMQRMCRFLTCEICFAFL